ncbi:MAG: peroxidase family protein [Litoreibacter sp.]
MAAHSIGYVNQKIVEKANEAAMNFVLYILEQEFEGETLDDAYETLVQAFYKDEVTGDLIEREWPIPSGHVYLAQLMAHDLIQTSSTGHQHKPFENIVRRPLMLETIYGRGPDVQPFLFQTRRDVLAPEDRPRFRPEFRISVLNQDNSATLKGLDLPRAAECEDTCSRGKRSCDPNFTRREAIIADRRNDSHTILAQITAVWMKFHNSVYSSLVQKFNDPTEKDERLCFESSRRIVIRSWHNVIRNDILPYILKSDSASQNGGEASSDAVPYKPSRPCEDWVDPSTGLPSAEARIALRCLHCLPRTFYGIGTGTIKSLESVLKTGSEQLVDQIDETWIADWASFFDLKENTPAYNRTRYYPRFAMALARSHDGTHLLRADLERVLSILSSPDPEAKFAKFSTKNVVAMIENAVQRLKISAQYQPNSNSILEKQGAVVTRFPPLLIELMNEASEEVPPSNLGKNGTRLLSPWLLGALEQADQWNHLTNEECLLVADQFERVLEATNQI